MMNRPRDSHTYEAPKSGIILRLPDAELADLI
jgi:hypothetical protein